MGFERAGALAVVGGALLSVLLARDAWAEPTAAEKETARTMMDLGHARRDVGDHGGALVQFQAADAIMHVPTTGLETAREQVAMGQLVEARDTLARILRAPVGDGEPEILRAARRSAEALDAELPPRIPSLRITTVGVPAGVAVQVTVDGTPIPPGASVAPFKVDPGAHVVIALGGGASVRRTVDLTEGQTASIELDLTPVERAGAPPGSAERGPPSPVARTGSSTVAWLRWGGVGLAGAGLVVGSITGAMSLASTSAATRGCSGPRCPPPTWADIDSARTTATISTTAFIVAGVGAALGVASFFVGSGPSSSAPVSAWMGPAGVAVAGAF